MMVEWQILSFDELCTDQLYALLRLRQQVFVVEQQSIYLDLDDKDQRADHMLCRDGATLLAYQRCLPPGVSYPESSLGRIVVARVARGRQLGRQLVQRGVDYNLRRWPGAGIVINAQSYLQDFYRDLGFEAEGEEYLEDGIPHRRMRLARC
jgi:ElaA protein